MQKITKALFDLALFLFILGVGSLLFGVVVIVLFPNNRQIDYLIIFGSIISICGLLVILIFSFFNIDFEERR